MNTDNVPRLEDVLKGDRTERLACTLQALIAGWDDVPALEDFLRFERAMNCPPSPDAMDLARLLIDRLEGT